MKRRQFELHHTNATKLVTWLDDDPRLKRGVRITLKEFPDIEWVITRAYHTLVDERYFHRKWNFDYCEKLPGLKLTS